MRRGTSVALLLLTAIVVSGCALPLPLKVASWAIDGISYLATQKSIADHGISLALKQDCAMLKIVTDGALCEDLPETGTVVVEAASPPAAPAVQEPTAVAAPGGESVSEKPAREPESAPLTSAVLLTSAAVDEPVQVAALAAEPTAEELAGFATAAGGETAALAPAAVQILPEDADLIRMWQSGGPRAIATKIETDFVAAAAPQRERAELADVQVVEVAAKAELPEGAALIAFWTSGSGAVAAIETDLAARFGGTKEAKIDGRVGAPAARELRGPPEISPVVVAPVVIAPGEIGPDKPSAAEELAFVPPAVVRAAAIDVRAFAPAGMGLSVSAIAAAAGRPRPPIEPVPPSAQGPPFAGAHSHARAPPGPN